MKKRNRSGFSGIFAYIFMAAALLFAVPSISSVSGAPVAAMSHCAGLHTNQPVRPIKPHLVPLACCFAICSASLLTANGPSVPSNEPLIADNLFPGLDRRLTGREPEPGLEPPRHQA